MSEVNHVKQRSVYLDVIKGNTIILVVFAHCIQFGSGELFCANQQCFDDPLFSFIYGFHMPLFMAVSGFLFWNSVNRHTARLVAVSRVRSLLVPIIVWQSLFLLFLFTTGQVSLSPSLLYSYRGALWFLWSVLICSIFMLIGHICFKDSLLLGVIVWIMLLFVPEKYLSNLHIFMYPYFMVGYFWNRYRLQERYNLFSHGKKWILCGVSFAFFMLFYVFYDTPDKSIYQNGTCLLGRHSVSTQLFIDMARYIYGFVGVSMVMILVDQLLHYLKDSVVCKYVVEFGKMSLGIYVINHYTYELMLLLPISSNFFYLLTFIETIVTIVFICIVIKLIEKSRIASLLLLGRG